MTPVERALGALLVLAGLLVVSWLGVLHYSAARYDAGYAAAVGAGVIVPTAVASASSSVTSASTAGLRRAPFAAGV